MVIVFILSSVGFIAAVVFPVVKDPHPAFGVIGDITSVAMYAGPIRQMVILTVPLYA
jgi:hypothetical protein